jgi:hypothetical protein
VLLKLFAGPIIGLSAMFMDRLAAIKRCGRLRSRLHGIPDIGDGKAMMA